MTRVICNPLNLEYKYQETVEYDNKICAFRESADPTVVLYRDQYFMFASMTGGFWYSENLIDWKFVEKNSFPIYDYAPDVCEINGYLYLSASRNRDNCSIYRIKDPILDEFEEVKELFPFWDPNLFYDEDGRIYLYWGCSNKNPIYGVELDKDSLLPLSDPIALIHEDSDHHGWEKTGVNNDPEIFENEYAECVAKHIGTKPFIEGAYMTKKNGIYYLQYAAPATERNTYGDGVYIGRKPLGPFTYCEHNPFSLKPGGFITGAGHGSTFEDKYGNWWHVATMRIGINHPMERRIGLFPVSFENQILTCNQNFADYPMEIPDRKIDVWNHETKQMLLSYHKPVEFSSQQDQFPASNITNENIQSIWVAQSNEPGEFLIVDLEKVMDILSIQLNFSDKIDHCPSREDALYCKKGHTKRYLNMDCGKIRYLLEGSCDKENWIILEDKRNVETSYPNDFIVFNTVKKYRYVRITFFEVPYHQKFAMSDLRIFGQGKGEKPVRTTFNVTTIGKTSVHIKWEKNEQAVGHNIRYGLSEHALYNSWMVYEDNELILNGLNANHTYAVTVDAFNENGITYGETKRVNV